MKLHSGKNRPPVKLWLSLFLIMATVACFHKRETERYQALAAIDSAAVRLDATLNFIRDYPKSDSLFPAIKSALTLWETSGQSDRTLQFILDQRLIQSEPEIRQFLDRALAEKLAPDSVAGNQFFKNLAKYQQKHPDELAFALTVMPYLSTGFQSDSIRNLQISRFGKLILQSGYGHSIELKKISDRVLDLNDSLLTPLANRFLVAAIKNNTPAAIRRYFPDATDPDSIRNQHYYTFYTALAWNAYCQGRFSYALNLMSQASKYGNLENQNGYIILGAAQAQCGELSEGWANVLKGLILNPDAEKQSSEIDNLYREMFYRIRGARENPARFLKQYRRSHR